MIRVYARSPLPNSDGFYFHRGGSSLLLRMASLCLLSNSRGRSPYSLPFQVTTAPKRVEGHWQAFNAGA
jgi:hypothetical protein